MHHGSATMNDMINKRTEAANDTNNEEQDEDEEG
jgi:hypothetical protein